MKQTEYDRTDPRQDAQAHQDGMSSLLVGVPRDIMADSSRIVSAPALARPPRDMNSLTIQTDSEGGQRFEWRLPAILSWMCALGAIAVAACPVAVLGLPHRVIADGDGVLIFAMSLCFGLAGLIFVPAIFLWRYRSTVQIDADGRTLHYMQLSWPYKRRISGSISELHLLIHRLRTEFVHGNKGSGSDDDDVAIVSLAFANVTLLLGVDSREKIELWLKNLPPPLRDRYAGDGAEFSLRRTR